MANDENRTTRTESWLSAATFSGTIVMLAGMSVDNRPAAWIGAICLVVGGNGLRWVRGM